MIRFFKRHKTLFIGIVLVVVAGVAGTYYYLRNRTQYNVVAVEKGPIIEAVYGIGTINAWKNFDLKVGVASIVQSVFVKEGDFVKKGVRLVELDGPRVFTAPFDGTVTSLPFKAGENVFPQVSILTLTDFNDRYLVVSLEQQAAIRVIPGLSARLSFESLRNQFFEAKVDSIYSNGDRFLTRISSSDLPKEILPGMTADVSITIRKHENALLVPITAIDADQILVRHKNGDEEKIAIKTGVIDANKAQIISGNLLESDAVLVKK